MSLKIEKGGIYKAISVTTGQNDKGPWLMIKTAGKRSEKDKTVATVFVLPVVEIHDGGTFKVLDIPIYEIKNSRDKNGVWHNNHQHTISIEVIQKEPPQEPDSFGGFDFSEQPDTEPVLPF